MVRTRDSVMYADILKVMPWRFYQAKNYNELVIYLRREKKQTEQEQHRNIGLFGRFYFIFFQYSLLSSRDKNMSVLEKEVRTLNLPYCMFAPVVNTWTYVTHEEWRAVISPPVEEEEDVFLHLFHLLFTSIKAFMI